MSGLNIVPRPHDVLGRPYQNFRRILEFANCQVALGAEDAPNITGSVVMVDVFVFSSVQRRMTNAASVALLAEDVQIRLLRNPVSTVPTHLFVMLALILAGAGLAVPSVSVQVCVLIVVRMAPRTVSLAPLVGPRPWSRLGWVKRTPSGCIFPQAGPTRPDPSL